jgi:hypothetical protein
MFFLLPLIGAAVGVVAGACITHANGEKDRRSSQHHRQVANKLTTKYSDSQARYNKLNNNIQKRCNDINQQKALDETEKDLLRLTIRLQQSLYILMWDIDENPTKESLIGFEQAVIATNKVLRELKEEIIQVPAEYFSRNLERAMEIGAKHPSVLTSENVCPILQCRKCGKKNRIRPHGDNRSPICGNCKFRLVDEIIELERASKQIDADTLPQEKKLTEIKNRDYTGTFSTYESYINWFRIYWFSLTPLSEQNFYYSWRYSSKFPRSSLQ